MSKQPDKHEKRDISAITQTDDIPACSGQLLRAPEGQVTLHSGPLPSPKDLAEYEKTCPGLARDIFEWAKSEQNNRHVVEIRTLNVQNRDIDLQFRTLDLQERKQQIDQRFGMNGQLISAALFLLYLILLGVIAFLGLEAALGIGLGAAVVVGFPRMMSLFIRKNGKPKPDKD